MASCDKLGGRGGCTERYRHHETSWGVEVPVQRGTGIMRQAGG